MKFNKIIPMLAICLLASIVGCNDDDTDVDQGTTPTITTTSPLNEETSVSRNNTVSVTFSEAMDPATINTSSFTVKKGTTNITGTISYSGVEAVFTPSETYEALEDYTATITTSAKSLLGNSLESNLEWTFTTGGSKTTITEVDLGIAADYVILAKTAINVNNESAITGDIGLSPAATTFITGLSLTDNTGFATSAQITGKAFAADMADPTPINLTTAVNNMVTAYNDAAGRVEIDFLELGAGNIGGKTLTPGIYKWTNTVTIPTDVTLSGSATDVWIFQIAEDLLMSSETRIILSGGADVNNIFWQVAGQATFGTTSHFEGIILSMTGITYQTGASMNGRSLAQTAVILDGNVINKP